MSLWTKWRHLVMQIPLSAEPICSIIININIIVQLVMLTTGARNCT